ncbi:unnamed protein product [Mytilus coruscus]|uniref:Uncharacterized protein n=1 Tax=Mytilus coruscus TaxID=42192 RepID=A0A6J8CKA0_MYTCO|nr:unnamed protein product [Mytilus coruscus]
MSGASNKMKVATSVKEVKDCEGQQPQRIFMYEEGRIGGVDQGQSRKRNIWRSSQGHYIQVPLSCMPTLRILAQNWICGNLTHQKPTRINNKFTNHQCFETLESTSNKSFIEAKTLQQNPSEERSRLPNSLYNLRPVQDHTEQHDLVTKVPLSS